MWNRSLPCHIKQALCLKGSLERLEFPGEEAHATCALHTGCDQLISASRAIEIDATTNDHNLSNCWSLLTGANCTTKANYIEGRLFISQREVLVAGRAAHGALHLTQHEAIC